MNLNIEDHILILQLSFRFAVDMPKVDMPSGGYGKRWICQAVDIPFNLKLTIIIDNIEIYQPLTFDIICA